MITPPTNSANTNCHPMRTAKTIPSSTTRLVEANMNTMAATKSAPPAKRERARAEAAYEQLDDTIPYTDARATEPGRWSPKRRVISSRDTKAWTAPERTKPRTRAQSVSQNM
jgi:hypothetical protein